MKRISVEMVREAYAKTGLKPGHGSFFPKANCACALGALYYEKHGLSVDDPQTVREFLDAQYQPWYVTGFARGFDGMPRILPAFCRDGMKHAEIRCGYADGQACAAAVFSKERS